MLLAARRVVASVRAKQGLHFAHKARLRRAQRRASLKPMAKTNDSFDQYQSLVLFYSKTCPLIGADCFEELH